jgi:mersacidin/lichenicidin family type 2 lantibiotic
MTPNQIVRAWKDSEFRATLPAESATAMPAHPIGEIAIADSQLDLSGGAEERTEYFESLGCCQGFTQAGKCDITAGGGMFFCTGLCFTLILTQVEWCPAT